MFRVIMSLAVLASFAPTVNGEDPKANPDFEKAIQYLRDNMGKRVNGAKLSATAEVKQETIQVKWTLDYTGPRPPLVIIKPTFPACNGDSTIFRVFVPGRGQAERHVRLKQDCPAGTFLYRKDMFIIVERGNTASDTISLPVSRIKSALAKEWPEFDNGKPPARLYLQLHHLPRERGNRLLREPGQPEPEGLDAWTGDLESAPLKIELMKW